MSADSDDQLERALSPFWLTLYGVGVIVGAGIYVLVGKVVGVVGGAAWMALAAAAVAALPTAMSYAELASRYPRSAGEAVFVARAFDKPWLSFSVGYLVLASGVASTAAVSHGFAGYFANLVGLSESSHLPLIIGFLIALSILNHRGIRESAWVNAVCTLTSVGALLVLVVAGMHLWGEAPLLDFTPPGGVTAAPAAAVLAGAALSFYAFIGFEDICNVAEEAKNPKRTLPIAILGALAIATVLYVVVGMTVVAAVPLDELAGSDIPLALVAERLLPSLPHGWLSLIALFAIVNTALFNLIMSSRILYGMASQGWIPGVFARVHAKRKTPTYGVAGAFVLAATFALTGVLQVLAEATNTIILTAFFSVNLALVVVRMRRIPPDDPDEPHFRTPLVFPLVGAALTAYLAAQFSPGAYIRALGLLAVGVVLYLVHAAAARK